MDQLLELDRKMQDGYMCSLDNKDVEAAKLWREVFIEMKKLFSEFGVDSLAGFDKVFNGQQFVSNWVQDYDDLLHNNIVSVDGEVKARYGKEKIELLEFLLGIDVSNDLNHLNNLRSLAETYYLLGEDDKGKEQFEKLISDYPDYVWGYVGYSDQYWRGDSNIDDYVKSVEILVKASEREKLDEKDVLIDRLSDIQNEIRKIINQIEKEGKREEDKSYDEIRELKKYEALNDIIDKIRKTGRAKPVKQADRLYINQPIVKGPKIGRNEPCPCGSGKKYKKCCGR